MKSHGAKPQKRKGGGGGGVGTAAPTVLKNIENSREQEDICHMTLTASQTLDLNSLQEKRLIYLQLSY